MSLASNNPFLEAKPLGVSPPPQSEDQELDAAAAAKAAAEIAKLEPLKDPENFKTYVVYNTAAHIDLRLALAGSAEMLYYVAHSTFTPGTPDLVLHAGSNKKAPVVGVAKMGLLNKAEKIGLGDPNIEVGPDQIIWEELTKLSTWTHKSYGFEWQREKYEWRRTKTVAWDVTPDIVLVKAGTRELDKRELDRGVLGPEVLALYLNKSILEWNKRGTLEIRNGGDEKWEMMVLLTGLTLLEGARRRSRQRR